MIAHRAPGAPRAYGMTSVDDGGPATTPYERYRISNATLEIWAQVDPEGAGSVAYIPSRSGTHADGPAKRDEVGADLQLIALVNALAASRRFDLERVQTSLVRRTVLEDIIGPATQA